MLLNGALKQQPSESCDFQYPWILNFTDLLRLCNLVLLSPMWYSSNIRLNTSSKPLDHLAVP